MKRTLKLFAIIISLFIITGCNKVTEDGLRFKEEYESLNNQKMINDIDYRNVGINEVNPFVYITPEEVVEKIENKETFYVYFGDKMCPWCRSVIESFIETANKNKIKKVYYINIWDDEHNEILRDKYKINDKDKLEKINDGTESYYKFLEYFDELLTDYTLTNSKNKTVEVGEKRIMAPNFIYIESGKAKKIVSGISESLTSYDAKLTSEIINEQAKIFKEFFDNNTN